MKTSKGMTKNSIVFNGKNVWKLGGRLERDLSERTTSEVTQSEATLSDYV